MRTEIALIENIQNTMDGMGKAEALRSYARSAGKSLELQNACAEIRLRYERRAGELLKEREPHPPGPDKQDRSHDATYPPKLEDVGINRSQSSRWQKIAGIPENDFEEFLVRTKAALAEITTAGALKLFRAAEVQERREGIMEMSFSPHGVSGGIIHACMQEEIASMSPGFADLILTDPPFGLGGNADIGFSERANMSQTAGEWDGIEVVGRFAAWCEMFRQAIKPSGSLFCFVSDVYISEMYAALRAEAFIVRELLVWRKTNPPPSVRKAGYRSDVEYIIYATAGEHYTRNWLGQGRMLKCQEHAICGGKERLDHPTQKPVGLLKQYIEVSTNQGDLVLDPFAGVGSTGAAASELVRDYLLIERDDYYYRQACLRLQ